MKRQTRERSNTGICQMMLKAIKVRNIVLNDEENEIFIKKISNKIEEMR